MKGIIGYILAMLITCILTVVGFYFLGKLLDAEIEISSISKKYSTIINEAEYSQFYFKKYLEGKYYEDRLRGASYEAITKEIPGTIVRNSNSRFELLNTYQENGFFVVEGRIRYNYKDSENEISLSKKVKFNIPI
ncbi:MAG: hypothetical protein QW472_02890 [Candidatus Aenigmatarchaeota archaeon]